MPRDPMTDSYAFTFESIPDRRSLSNHSHLEVDPDVRALPKAMIPPPTYPGTFEVQDKLLTRPFLFTADH